MIPMRWRWHSSAPSPTAEVSFAEEVRAELSEVLPAAEHCRAAQLSGVLRHAGSLHLHGRGEIELHADLASSIVARRTVELLRARGARCEIRTYSEHRFQRRTRFLLVIEGNPRSLQLLNEIGVLAASLAPAETVPRRLVSRACCRRAYLRGAFLAAGSISHPRSGAHLEWRCSTLEAARALQALAAIEGAPLLVHDGPRYALAYAKSRETIRELLASFGAYGAELRLEEAEVVALTRGSANRMANADAGNLRRQATAAAHQLAAIERLGGPANLPPDLRRVAEARVRMPDATLEELATGLHETRATIAGRLRRIRARAQ